MVSKRDSIRREIRRFLDYNPCKVFKIRDNVPGFYYWALYKDKKVSSFGTIGNRVYYLKNQEDMVYPKIEEALRAKPPRRTWKSSIQSKKENIILEKLTEPTDTKGLIKLTGLTECQLSMPLSCLEKQKKIIRTKRMYVGKKGERAHILRTDHFYLPGKEMDMADLIIERTVQEFNSLKELKNKDRKVQRITSLKDLSAEDKRVLSQSIKDNLSETVYGLVHDSYIKY